MLVLNLAHMYAHICELLLGFHAVLVKAPPHRLVGVVRPWLSIGILGQLGSSVLKRVVRLHIPAHDIVLGTYLYPLGRLVASHRTHVVVAIAAPGVLGYASLGQHLVEPFPKAIYEER